MERFIGFRWTEDEGLDIANKGDYTFLGVIKDINKGNRYDPNWTYLGWKDKPDWKYNIVVDTKKSKIYLVRIFWKQTTGFHWIVSSDYKIIDELDYPNELDETESSFEVFLDFVSSWLDEKTPIRESRHPHGRMLREGENKSEEFMKELVAIVEEASPFMGDNFIDVETDYNGGESWSGFINFTDGTINRQAAWMPGTYGNLHLKGVDTVSSKNVAKVQKLVDSLESEDDKIVSFFEDNLDRVNDMLPETAKPFKTSEAAFKWYMNFDPDEESDQYDIFGGTSHSGERKNLEVFYEELNDDINEYIQEFYGESPAFVGILVTLDDDKEEGKVCRVESYVNDDLGYGREAVGAWAGKNVIGEGLGNHYIYDQAFTWKNLSDLKRNLTKHVALAAETIGAD